MFCAPFYLLLNSSEAPLFFIQLSSCPTSTETQKDGPKDQNIEILKQNSHEKTKETDYAMKTANAINIQKKNSSKSTKFLYMINKKFSEVEQQDQQFNPNDNKAKRENKTSQNENRNIIPNIIHQVISYLQKKGKSLKMVDKLIAKLGVSQRCSSKRFYYYQQLLKDKWNHYVNPQSLLMYKKIHVSLIQIISQEQQELYNRISRMLVHYFLTKEFNSSILTSKRVNSQKRLDHLMAKRNVLEEIGQVYRK